MPTALLDRVRAAANAKAGFDNVEFIASAFVDLAFIASPILTSWLSST